MILFETLDIFELSKPAGRNQRDSGMNLLKLCAIVTDSSAGRFSLEGVAASDPCDRSSFCWQILIDSVFFTYVCFTFQICSSLEFCRIVPMSIVDKSFQQKTSHAHLTKLDILVSLHVTTMLLILSSFDVFCRHVSAFNSKLLNLKHLDFKQTHWTLFLTSLVF